MFDDLDWVSAEREYRRAIERILITRKLPIILLSLVRSWAAGRRR